ncbi:hypothetical protein Trydic_g327 [Trypoxylus dichotomus]
MLRSPSEISKTDPIKDVFPPDPISRSRRNGPNYCFAACQSAMERKRMASFNGELLILGRGPSRARGKVIALSRGSVSALFSRGCDGTEALDCINLEWMGSTSYEDDEDVDGPSRMMRWCVGIYWGGTN